jgi:FAD/FMN-containing dehydrogenase
MPTTVVDRDDPSDDRAGALVSLRRLNRIVRVDRENLALVAEAGVTIGALREEIGGTGLWCPALRWLPADTTIGCAVAGGHGRRSQRYGAVADYLLGLQFLCPATGLTRHGGLAIKNATGYNLSRCVAGSRGRLAVVVEVTLRLVPVPPGRFARRYLCRSLDEAWIFAASLTQASSAANCGWSPECRPAAIELWTELATSPVDLLVEGESAMTSADHSLKAAGSPVADSKRIEVVAADRWPPGPAPLRVLRRVVLAPSRVKAAVDALQRALVTTIDRSSVLAELTGGAVELWAAPTEPSRPWDLGLDAAIGSQPAAAHASANALARALKTAFDPAGLLLADDALGSYEVFP